MFIPSIGRRVRASALLLCVASIGYSQTPIPRGSILISHLSPDHGLATDEFVVLYNAGPDTVDLGGYEVRYATASGSIGSAGAVFPSSRSLPPARHLLLASRETVSVGSARAIRDVPFTSGMAATGGQLMLRRVDLPDSIVFAVAWGSVSDYLVGMTDAAAWPGDGMLSLAWNGGAYARSAYNASNLEYQHTPAASITVVPSLHPIVPPSPWSITVVVRQDDAADTSVVFGMSDAATDSFDIGLDLPAPPPPISGQLSVGIDRSDLNLATGPYLLRDLRAVRSLSDATDAWAVSLLPATAHDPVEVACVLRGLPESMPVRIRLGDQRLLVERSKDSAVTVFTPGSIDRLRLDVMVGDSTAPIVQILEPVEPMAAVAGSNVRIRAILNDGSGLDSIRLSFVDLIAGTARAVPVGLDSLEDFNWLLPDRLLSDSTRFEIEAVDAMGNRQIAVSVNVRIVPDTARREFEAGWHLMSTPLEPIDPRWSVTAGATPADPAYVYTFARRAGYLLADSLEVGRGYFLGLLRPTTISVTGLRSVDSGATALASGFVLVGSPRHDPTPLSHLVFERAGTERSHTDAINAGWVGAGLFGFDHSTGSYYGADTLQPWHGYWLPVLEEGVSFRTATVVQQSGGRVRSTDGHGWRARIVLASGFQVDSLITIGAMPEATDGFDPAFDLPAPPQPPGERVFTAWIEHPEWGLATGPNILNDIRSQRNGHEWTVVLRSNHRVPVEITWRTVSHGVVKQLELMLSTDRIVRQLAEGDTLHFLLEGEVHAMIRASVTSVTPSSFVPGEFRMTDGFPNPFNASTHFEVEVPEPGHLTIGVFDLLGRQVAQLVDTRVDAGVVSVAWTSTVSTGAYLVRAAWRGNNGMSEVISRRVVALR